jgi:hypothetical protein
MIGDEDCAGERKADRVQILVQSSERAKSRGEYV